MALFAVLGLAMYGPSLGNGFVQWDDTLLITENPLIRSFTPEIFATYDPELYISQPNEGTLRALDREYEFGIDWGAVQNFGDLGIRLRQPTTSGGLEFSLSNSGESVTAVLDALETQGDVRVLSSPGVTALNNQRAVFNVTTEEVFFAVTREPIRDASGNVIQFQTTVETQPVAVGIVMDVLPQISADEVITMNVRPMVTSLDRVEEFQQDDNFARAPVVDRRELDTMVRVRSGETHVIGGLIQTREETTRSGVPVLKDLPVLGWLFGRTVTRERRSELVIFITPTIIAGHSAGP